MYVKKKLIIVKKSEDFAILNNLRFKISTQNKCSLVYIYIFVYIHTEWMHDIRTHICISYQICMDIIHVHIFNIKFLVKVNTRVSWVKG